MADRLALIIANGDFDDPKLSRLETPTRDAEALAEVLDDPDIGDFDVTLLVDQPEGAVRRKIGRFYHRRKRSDLLLLYYSGHGIRDEHGDLYLATKDTEIDIAGATALSASFVRERIDKSGSQRKVVVLDCCHSGAFAKAGLGDSVGTQDAFAGSGYGRVILTASDALELSWQGAEWLGDGRPSVFTHFLVEGLRTGAADLDGDGRVTLNELYDYVYERVLTSGYAMQTPHRFLEVEGCIFVARVPERPKRKLDLVTITSPIHLELVRVPAGEFLIGSDPAKDEQAYIDEQPLHTLDLPEFHIGKYPITNRQYAAFVQAKGHEAPRFWEHDKPPSDTADHPVRSISLCDARAFCEWLSRETKRDFRLPSEAEWEKAARGTDGRIYPWGNEPPRVELCNFGHNVDDTTPVGKYSPQGDSPYGCADMAGNVWEWTRSLWRDYPYDAGDGRENLEEAGVRVLRGGSLNHPEYYVRCAYRPRYYLYYRWFNVGFRVVVAPFSPTSKL